jgi:hypothetical protein
MPTKWNTFCRRAFVIYNFELLISNVQKYIKKLGNLNY